MRIVVNICLIILVFAAKAQEIKWDYPIKPSSQEWNLLENNISKVNACQIPEDILYITETEDLLLICLQYPLLFDIYAFSNLGKGIEKFYNDFNGVRELFSRSDVNNCILSLYKEEVYKQAFLEDKETGIERGEFIVLLSTLELFLGIAAVHSPTDRNTKKDIVKYLLEAYEMKKGKPHYYKGVGLKTNIYTRAIIISEVKNGYFEDILYHGKYDAKTIEAIDAISNLFIKE